MMDSDRVLEIASRLYEAAVTPNGGGVFFENLSMTPDAVASGWPEANREFQSPEHGDQQPDLLAHLALHARKAADIARRLDQARTSAATLEFIAEHWAMAVLALSANGKILYSNAAAHDMLAAEEAFIRRESHLVAMRKGDHARLYQMIAASLSNTGSPWSSQTPVGSFERRSGATPYQVFMLPYHDPVPLFCIDRPSVLMFAATPEAGYEMAHGALMAAWKLSRPEANLAVTLAQGATLVSAASQLGIAKNTARVWLGSIFRKMGINRQAELVRLIALMR